MRCKVYEITGEYAISAAQGQKLFDQIFPILRQGNVVELDFSGVKIYGSPFLNYGIGQLLKDLPSETLRHVLKISGLTMQGKFILRQVVDNARRYYTDIDYQQAVNTVLAELAMTA